MQIHPNASNRYPALQDKLAAEQGLRTAPAGTPATPLEPAHSQKTLPTTDAEQTTQIVRKLNASPEISATNLRFNVDEETGKVVVKLVDQGTGEVLRQMPSEEALRITKALDRMSGRLLDQKA